MSFEEWWKDTFCLSQTGNDKELLRIAYQAGKAEQKEESAQTIESLGLQGHPRSIWASDFAAAIRNQEEAE